ncbi:MAG: PilN domain-containing protein [Pseudomonadota bacterium]
MKPVRLRFEHPPATWRQRLLGHASKPSAALALLGLLGAMACGAAVAWQSWKADDELAQARVSLAALHARKGRRADAAATTPQMTAPQRQAWEQVARQLGTPWAALLDALEAGTPADVALVAIEPDARTGSVRLQAEARTLDTLLAYAGTLGASPLFEGASLVKHETNEQDGNKPMRLGFELRLKARRGPQAGAEAAR